MDPLVAVLVLGLSLLPLWEAEQCGCAPSPGWGYALLSLQCLPLAMRRRWPFTVALLCGLVTVVYGLSALPDPPLPYAGLVALYTAAAHATRRLAQLAGVVAAIGIAVALVLDGPRSDVQDLLSLYVVFATAWLLGDSTRNRRDRARELEERAAALERTRAAEAERAVVEERNRIARELHDVVAHSVSTMVVQAEAGPVVLARDPARAVQAFDAISATGKQALAEMRRLLGVLRADRDERRAPQPGADRIPELVERVRAAGLDVTLEVRGTLRQLPPAVDLSAYRLLQEALTNALRHAAPARVTATLEYGHDALRLEVLDDGSGTGGRQLDTPASGGHGLVAMRERVGLVGGCVQAGPRAEGGWAVHAVLPLEPPDRPTSGASPSTADGTVPTTPSGAVPSTPSGTAPP